MTVIVLGASGYAGQILMRLLMDHPKVDSIIPVSSSAAGFPIDDRDAGLGPDLSKKLPKNRLLASLKEAMTAKPDVVISALPHGTSAEICRPFIGQALVLDLSADFRLRDPQVHLSTYGIQVPLPEIRGNAVYGLAEVYSKEIRNADLIAVPGCYPTSVLLPLIPLIRGGILSSMVTVNSLSGISGAGRSPKESSMFVEREGNAVAYNPGRRHRHHSEMVQEIKAAGVSIPLFFTPHLVPMRRGMLSTISFLVDTDAENAERQVGTILKKAYKNEPFISLRGWDIPTTRDVTCSNRCDIGWMADSGDGGTILYLFSAIDNLVKGASGQAIQCMNIRFGFPVEMGLPLRGEV